MAADYGVTSGHELYSTHRFRDDTKHMIMKAILKVLTFPIVLILDLFTWICVGLISCSAVLFKLASAVLAILAVAVLITYSGQNGLILLTLAFLVSPLGLPMIAVWLR